MFRIALSLALVASALPGTAMAATGTNSGGATGPAQTAEATARCIAANLAGSAQIHRNAAGDYVVTAFAPRKVASRWMIPATGGEITLLSGRAGADRGIRAACQR